MSTRGGNVIIVVPPGTTHYDVSASTAGGSVSDTVPLNTSSPDKITVTSGGGDITIRQVLQLLFHGECASAHYFVTSSTGFGDGE